MSGLDLQGHRGARGLRPENTLPSFEAALDVGVTSIETDVHLTADGVPVLYHDSFLSEGLCVLNAPSELPQPAHRPRVRSLTLAQLKTYRIVNNPNLAWFPDQLVEPTPLAARVADDHPFKIPTLTELFEFVTRYAADSAKTAEQRANACRVVFDLELKRVPFRSDWIDDGFSLPNGGELERAVVAAVRSAGVVSRTRVRSFDHRCVAVLRRLEPGLQGAVLVAGTMPIDPVALVRAADAVIYCPEVNFVDESTIQALHAAEMQIIPWTVNDPADWQRLIAWGVDGITTDFPDRLATLLAG